MYRLPKKEQDMSSLTNSDFHTVKKVYSGKLHFFEVTSKSGEKYNVSIQANCDCRFMGIQGIANGKICSHIIAVCKKIGNEGIDNDIEPAKKE